MSSITWTLDLHTKAKHRLLKLYLDRWFPILGRWNKRINYIDGFAGPGQYAKGEIGSPLIALESAKQHVEQGTLASDVVVNFAFVESNKSHADHLHSLLKQQPLPEQFKIVVLHGEFRERLAGILGKIESDNSKLAPTFAFVDPFGFSGIPLALMARILKFPKCEVFINIMVDFINRFLEHPNAQITSHFPETFGSQTVLDIPQQQGDRLHAILSLYKAQLRKHARFVGRFDMHGRTDRMTYSLFFGTNGSEGIKKMKEAMWAVDQESGSKFSGADPTPASLFKAWSHEPLWDELKMKYAGKSVKMSELEQFVIEETDFLPTHARKLFKLHEGKDLKVDALPGQRRVKGTYHRDKVLITFTGESQ
jgi:three-Cys-motif partner protein